MHRLRAKRGTIDARRSGPTPEPAGARIISLAKVTCDGVEVTQAIQNMNHDVPLVARKRTVVRVYLSANTGAPDSRCSMCSRSTPPAERAVAGR